jgi:YidC/Oxa1 family membrane protein insertase
MAYRGSQGPDQTRNLIIAGVLCVLILVGFEFFYNIPMQQRLQAAQRAQAAQQHSQQSTAQTTPAPAVALPAEQVIAASAAQRVTIDTPSVDGSISLVGARLDNLNLRRYRRTVDRNSGEVGLLAPYESRQGGYDAFVGWEDRNATANASGACTANCGVGAADVWTAPSDSHLTPQTPVVLTFASPEGLQVTRTISIDQNFLFTISDVVRNTGAQARTLRPFGVVRRLGKPADWLNSGIVHQGFAGAFGPRQELHTETYARGETQVRDRAQGKVAADAHITEAQGRGGWLGISDHYWLGALIPDQHEQIDGYFDSRGVGSQVDYRSAYRGQWRDIPPGGSVTYTQRVFAGAKQLDLLQSYQRALDIPRFDEAVDWGNLMWPLTRPFFNYLLHPLARWLAGIGVAFNFGVAILLSTVVIKLLLFPLVYQSSKSMAKMRALQPKMKEVQERYAADPQRQQQETLKLYQTEKVNPAAGCLPILLTIPVFFALYKTLSVTIEMRHAPFFGWIHDLSAQDPASVINLFGLLPFNPHAIPLIGAWLAIGVWPILYGVSMVALQGLSPPPTDPTQAAIFRYLPIVYMFLFASFPAGLVIYWTWSNLITIVQQYAIMRRQGVETQFDKFLARIRQKPAAAE